MPTDRGACSLSCCGSLPPVLLVPHTGSFSNLGCSDFSRVADSCVVSEKHPFIAAMGKVAAKHSVHIGTRASSCWSLCCRLSWLLANPAVCCCCTWLARSAGLDARGRPVGQQTLHRQCSARQSGKVRALARLTSFSLLTRLLPCRVRVRIVGKYRKQRIHAREWHSEGTEPGVFETKCAPFTPHCCSRCYCCSQCWCHLPCGSWYSQVRSRGHPHLPRHRSARGEMQTSACCLSLLTSSLPLCCQVFKATLARKPLIIFNPTHIPISAIHKGAPAFADCNP